MADYLKEFDALLPVLKLKPEEYVKQLEKEDE